MRKYLFNKKQKSCFIVSSILFGTYEFLTAKSLELNADQFFRPYSIVLFVALVVIILLFIKHDNWKNKMRLLTLITVLSIMIFNTNLQLQNMFNSGTTYLNFDLAKNTDGNLNFDNIEKMSAWISNVLNFQIAYRISKILLIDCIAIFSYLAINKTLKEFKED